MNSNDPVGAGESISALSADDYKIVFQLSKELPNLPEARTAALGITSDQVTEVTRIAREVRRAGHVAFRFVADVQEDADARISAAKFQETVVTLPLAVLTSWRRLLLDVLSWLDERELFLRTGYRSDEIARVISRFPKDSTRPLREGDE